ncbi:MAG: hypothetical protein IT158_19035 [Bryobacterales bacterium]|nr:hypothetical protein [Bryobacterales bacterium]
MAAAALLIACWSAEGQRSPSLVFSPSVLFVGSGPAQLRISVVRGQSTGLSVRWNGVDKPPAVSPGSSFIGGYHIDLTAEELAAPGMAEVSLVDAISGVTIHSSFIFIGYNVVPNDVVYDRARNRFYLTTPAQSNDPAFPGDSLVALDPDTFQPGPVVAIGKYPTSLALSDDGASLYVAVDGDGLVRRVNLDTFTVSSDFRVRPAITGAVTKYARSAIAVMPGNPQTVAVYQHADISSSRTRIAIYDNGQRRGSEIASFDGYDSLLFTPDGKSLFLGSYANFNSPQSVLRYSVDATGVPAQTPASIDGGGPITIRDGILYTSRGTLIDIEKMQVRGLLGVGGGVAVDPVNQRILAAYFVRAANWQDYPQFLQAFDLATQEPLGGQSLDSWYYFGAGDNPGLRLIRFGADGLLYTGSKALLLFHTPLAGPAPLTEARAVVNAAGQHSGCVAPGEIISIYGANLGPAAPASAHLNPSGSYDPALSHVQVWFDETPGTLLLAYHSQLNVIAPFEMKPDTTVNLQVWHFGIPSARIPLCVAATAPALFTRDAGGSGPVAVVNQNGSINAPSRPGSWISVFGTGGGALPGAANGALARSAQRLNATVRATLGGREVPVLYAGSAPLMPHGLFQVNLQLPADAPTGIVPITISVNGHVSPEGAALEIR